MLIGRTCEPDILRAWFACGRSMVEDQSMHSDRTPEVTLAVGNRTPGMRAISGNDFVEELYLPHRAGVQELADIGVPLIFNLCIVPPPTGATDDLELIAITTQERFRQRTRNWFL